MSQLHGWENYLPMNSSVMQKIPNDIHRFVHDADYLNALFANQVKDDVLALWEAVVTVSDIGTMLS